MNETSLAWASILRWTVVTAVHWTKMRRPWLMADENGRDYCACGWQAYCITDIYLLSEHCNPLIYYSLFFCLMHYQYYSKCWKLYSASSLEFRWTTSCVHFIQFRCWKPFTEHELQCCHLFLELRSDCLLHVFPHFFFLSSLSNMAIHFNLHGAIWTWRRVMAVNSFYSWVW